MEEEEVNLMEEMNRFEAEIATEPPPGRAMPHRPIIGANTFNVVQEKLGSFPHSIRKFPQPPQHNAPLAPFGGMHRPPPPPPPGSMFPSGPPPPAFGIPPPPPPPSFLIPHQVRGSRPMAMTRPPPPPQVTAGPRARPGPVVLSAAPTKYKPPQKKSKIDDEISQFLNEIKKEDEKQSNKPGKSAQLMAESVRANTVVSVQPVSSQESYDPHQQQQQPAAHHGKPKKEKKNKKTVRMAGGQVWEDNSLLDWEDDDFRIFCGDLGNDVTDEILIRAFNKYPTFLRAKVVRDKRTNKTKGFGFVSFKDPQDFSRAMKEMNGKHIEAFERYRLATRSLHVPSLLNAS